MFFRMFSCTKKEKAAQAQKGLEKLVLELINNPNYPEDEILSQVTKFVKNGANLNQQILVTEEAPPPPDSERELKAIFNPPTTEELKEINSNAKHTVTTNMSIAYHLIRTRRTNTIEFTTRIFDLGGGINNNIALDMNRLGVYIAFQEYKGPK